LIFSFNIPNNQKSKGLSLANKVREEVAQSPDCEIDQSPCDDFDPWNSPCAQKVSSANSLEDSPPFVDKIE
jgi:hypothetical protein